MSETNKEQKPNGTDYDFCIFQEGQDLSEKQAEKLQERLAADDNDVFARLQLLGYYGCQKVEGSADNWVQHFIWMIENRSGDWLAGNIGWRDALAETHWKELEAVWMRQVDRNPDDAFVLGRAGQFLCHFAPQLAESLLKRSEILDAENPAWSTSLMNCYAFQMKDDAGSKALYGKLALDQAAIVRPKQNHRGEMNGLLTRSCDIALDIGDLDRASEYADALMQMAEEIDLPHREFQAHVFLGRIALRRGKDSLAEDHLLKAAYCGFFPALSLANEFLAQRKITPVLRFLELSLLNPDRYSTEIKEWYERLTKGDASPLG